MDSEQKKNEVSELEGKNSGTVQNFEKLRDECLRKEILFEDPDFKSTDSDAAYFEKEGSGVFAWKRPKEIVENPKFFADGESRFDIKQGILGDCWLLAGFAVLTLHKNLFYQVVPDDQSFEKNKYAGIFHFRFWQYGKWVEVIIDDRLPTIDGKLTSLHSGESNEFWSALLEKAYAKLCGSYTAMDGGYAIEGLVDFTGGVSELFMLKDKAPENLFELMLKSYEKGSLMSCSVNHEDGKDYKTPQNLIRQHAYSVTKVCLIDISTPYVNGKIPLVRVRNPWGEETEWNGAWSDKSPEWQNISDSEKEKIGLTVADDGEFWMSFQDFKGYYDRLYFCHVDPDALGGLTHSKEQKKWEVNMFEGEWIKCITACGEKESYVLHNPQFNLTITDSDGPCTIIISLMQKKISGAEFFLRINLYKLKDSKMSPDSVPDHSVKEDVFCSRQICLRCNLTPGVYRIVPHTKDADEEGKFFLRVFSEKKIRVEEIDEDNGFEITSPLKIEEAKEKEMLEIYNSVAGDGGKIDHEKLTTILNYFLEKELGRKGFEENTCRIIFDLLDVDRSRELCFEQLKSFWQDTLKWEEIFNAHSEKQRNQLIHTFKLRETLKKAGFKLKNRVLKLFVPSYTTDYSLVTFDDFIVIALKLNFVRDLFKRKNAVSSGTAAFKLEEVIEMMVLMFLKSS